MSDVGAGRSSPAAYGEFCPNEVMVFASRYVLKDEAIASQPHSAP